MDTPKRHHTTPAQWQLLWALLTPQRRSIVIALVLYGIKSAPLWLVPVMMADLLTLIATPHTVHSQRLIGDVSITALVLILNVPLHYSCASFLSRATRSMERQVRLELLDHLQRLALSAYQRYEHGALHTRLMRDVESVELLTKQLFEGALPTLVDIFVALIVTAIRVPEFLVVYLVLVPIAVVIFHSIRKPLRTRNELLHSKIEQTSSTMQESLYMFPITRAHGSEDAMLDRVSPLLEQVRVTGRSVDALTAIFGASTWGIFQFFDLVCLTTAAILGYLQLLPITIGDAFLVLSFFRAITASTTSLIAYLPQITKGFTAVGAISAVFADQAFEVNEGNQVLPNIQGAIQFEQVRFRYPRSDRDVLDQLTFTAHPGQVIAFVGPSGSGKTTLLHLITGLLRPTAGHVYVDGVDLAMLDKRYYRQKIAVVTQETYLFQGTIAENLCFGASEIDPQRFDQALHEAYLDEFLSQLPEGINTVIGREGAGLSGGQRQRLAIARALLRHPRILILDEATAALDTRSERYVKEALRHLMAGCTTFIVAHRLSTVQHADQIMVLDHGRIIEHGTHEELLAGRGLYATLAQH